MPSSMGETLAEFFKGRREAVARPLARFEELERLLSDPTVLADRARLRAYAKEHARLKPLAEICRQYRDAEQELASLREMLGGAERHPPMLAWAKEEEDRLRGLQRLLQKRMEHFLGEEDPEEDKSVILEIRAGTGGAEASLFAADLYRMYSRYAARQGWQVEPMSTSPTELSGLKEAIFGVEGKGVFGRLRFERGVHRVQRVPETEASGRIHTSTVTVAVLPQAQELEVQIDPKDLRIDVFRSSGPGGQGVNTADSAVRLTYLPIPLVVVCQDERSQLKNKAKAMKVLRARLLDLKRQEQSGERARQRRSQIGSGERSEKIRTYNFPDRRVTDHRLGLTSHRLEEILEGDLDELIGPLLAAQREGRLKSSGGPSLGNE